MRGSSALPLFVMASGRAAASMPPPLKVATWNVAGVNNNPFEFWIREGADDAAAYKFLMEGAERFLDSPGSERIGDIFTDAHFEELHAEMLSAAESGVKGWVEEHVHAVKRMWTEDFRSRPAVQGFLLAPEIGTKRLVSMPDRVTNTMEAWEDSSWKVINRPAVINCFAGGSIGTVQKWWPVWRDFMFRQKFSFEKEGASMPVAARIVPLSHKKYPAVTPDEEKVSVPLQILCLAVFDAVTVYMMNQVDPEKWEAKRAALAFSFGMTGKIERTLQVLARSYSDRDIVFLQETSVSFARAAGEGGMQETHLVVPLDKPDTRRPQNSLILLSRKTFPDPQSQDVTEAVLSGADAGLGQGDLLCSVVNSATGAKLLLASLHPDTNGLRTLPAVSAVAGYAVKHGLIPVLGIDANAHWAGNPGEKLGVAEFDEALPKLGLTSTWSQEGRPAGGRLTTFNARTCLQSQTNKAVRSKDVEAAAEWARRAEGEGEGSRPVNKAIDMHPKDFIIYSPAHYRAEGQTGRDSTGERRYVPGCTLPLPNFPSDHALVFASLQPAVETRSEL
eukprot:Hpha_TRINITY_DN12823_c0_g2::TRINITY_DN12823_c0_g2_i1::g.24250::m.24250